jgi:hypothetical protein
MKVFSWELYWKTIELLRFKGKRSSYRSRRNICIRKDFRAEEARSKVKRSYYSVSRECWIYSSENTR